MARIADSCLAQVSGANRPGRTRAAISRLTLASSLLMMGAFACEGSPAQARAVWANKGNRADGGGRLSIYDRGEIVEIDLLPADGTSLEEQELALTPGGGGAVLRGEGELIYFGIDDGRRLRLDVSSASVGAVEDVALAEHGDAIFWSEGTEFFVVPLSQDVTVQNDEDGYAVPLSLRWPDDPGPPTVDWAVSAPSSNLLFVSTYAGQAERLSVVQYPSEPGDPQRLARLAVTKTGAEDPTCATDLKLAAPGRPVYECPFAVDDCGVDYTIDPKSKAITIVRDVGGQASLWRWRWEKDPCFRRLDLPDAISQGPEGGDPAVLRREVRLTQAVDEGTYLFLDDRGIVEGGIATPSVVTWRTDGGNAEQPEIEAVPVLGPAPYSWSPVDEGRGITILSRQGPAVRVADEGFDVLNTRVVPCQTVATRGPVFSPDGMHAGWVCKQSDGSFGGGIVYRVSLGRLETYPGIPFVTLAIDDEGNMLMYSEQGLTEDGDGGREDVPPRTLYVLGRDEVVRRADKLEPVPLLLLVFGGRGEHRFIHGAAM